MRILRLISRLALGAALVYAGIGHLTFSRIEFQAQVPVWLPLDPDFVVVASGVVEILLGIGIAPELLNAMVELFSEENIDADWLSAR